MSNPELKTVPVPRELFEKVESYLYGRMLDGSSIALTLHRALNEAASPPPPVAGDEGATLQARVQPWMMACFGPEISADEVERGDRLLEEVFEALQSRGYDPDRVASLRDYVWSRPVGETVQEVGGVMITLAAFCLACGVDMHAAGETELARIWTKVEKIRAKQAAKPRYSPLPQAAPSPPPADLRAEAVAWRWRTISRLDWDGWVWTKIEPTWLRDDPRTVIEPLYPASALSAAHAAGKAEGVAERKKLQNALEFYSIRTSYVSRMGMDSPISKDAFGDKARAALKDFNP